MRNDFNVSIEQATWVGTAYLIPSVAFMPLQGYVGERWGVRRVYAIGLLVLSAGAFLSVLAPNFGWLLASRVVQGIGWSALYPLAMVMIRLQFASTRQGEMMGFWESAVGVTTIVAPLLGGALVQIFSWPSLYLVIGVVAALGLLLTLWAIPTTQVSGNSFSAAFDWSGALQFTLVLILGLVGIVRQNLLLLLGSGVMALVWLLLARRKSSPFVDARDFYQPSLRERVYGCQFAYAGGYGRAHRPAIILRRRARVNAGGGWQFARHIFCFSLLGIVAWWSLGRSFRRSRTRVWLDSFL